MKTPDQLLTDAVRHPLLATGYCWLALEDGAWACTDWQDRNGVHLVIRALSYTALHLQFVRTSTAISCSEAMLAKPARPDGQSWAEAINRVLGEIDGIDDLSGIEGLFDRHLA